MAKKFIDISEHNTILSFDKLAQSNLSGVIIKASEGTTYLDHACDVLYDALHNNVQIGFYHYLTSTSEPETQAQTFWDKIRGKEYQIVPVLDVEQDSLGDNAQSYSERFMEEL
jgi:GH25 family lysozyme M1 (1,4-beta-N-acetylmuramidase)